MVECQQLHVSCKASCRWIGWKRLGEEQCIDGSSLLVSRCLHSCLAHSAMSVMGLDFMLHWYEAHQPRCQRAAD